MGDDSLPFDYLPFDYLPFEEARDLYAAGDAAHDFDHVLRVTRLAERIAEAEGADVTVARLAALLHDVSIADAGEDGRKGHHFAAAAFARELLSERGMEPERVANVVHCIEAHRFRDRSVQPQTLEAKCLYDADKLDSIGAIGVGRAFAFAGAYGSRLWNESQQEAEAGEMPSGAEYTPVHEHIYKLRRILETLHTPTARAIGEKRHQFMVAFFDQLDAEMEGRA
jgi:uncharacterized protein